MTRRAALLTLLALATAACAGKAVRPRLPEGEDYVFPFWRPGELRPEEARRMEEAWRELLRGRTADAEKSYQAIASRRPSFAPAETGVGFARLRAGRIHEARRSFEAALASAPDYLPALVGAASSALRRGDPETALRSYRRALEVRPDDALVRRRLGEVKLQVTERRVTAAREALRAGDADQAISEYRAALDAAPEVAGLRVELADLLVGRGDVPGAVALLEADPARDRQVLLRLGELLVELKEYRRALDSYRRILARDSSDAEAAERALGVRQAIEFQQMPEEYRKILAAPQISRADLAALLSVKVTALARLPAGEPAVAVDISGSWAREHILKTLALGLLDVYPNHTFQPGAVARRSDLARALSRILDLLKWPAQPAPLLTDMSENNLFHDAAVRVVAAGLMDLTPDGRFQPWRPVSGRDAVDVIEALTRLVGP
jgi:tetratricopeptide (TPR) repeat protein